MTCIQRILTLLSSAIYHAMGFWLLGILVHQLKLGILMFVFQLSLVSCFIKNRYMNVLLISNPSNVIKWEFLIQQPSALKDF